MGSAAFTLIKRDDDNILLVAGDSDFVPVVVILWLRASRSKWLFGGTQRETCAKRPSISFRLTPSMPILRRRQREPHNEYLVGNVRAA